jgi:hypothetical protein
LANAAARTHHSAAVSAEPPFGLHAALADLGIDLSTALEEIPVSGLPRRHPRPRALGERPAAAPLRRPAPKSAFDLVAPESRQLARAQLAVKRFTGKPTHFEATLLDGHNRRIPVEINSVPLRHGVRFVGVFGLVTPPGELVPKPPPAQAATNASTA